MESRSAWTDARLDDRFDRVHADMADLREEIRSLREETREGLAAGRAETREGLAAVRAEAREGLEAGRADTRGLGVELRQEIALLHGEIGELRTLMIRFNGGMMIGLFGAIAAIVVRGA